MIFSDRGRKKINFFNKDPMSYSPDGKYIKHFEVPSPAQFKPYDGQKQYSLEKNKPEGLFFDQDSKRKEHDKMKQEYYDYCQYMMSLGKQPKSQQQYHNDIMNLAARPSTRDLKQAKQKFYAQELQRQIDEKNQQRFASQGNRNPVSQQYIGVNEDEVQVLDLQRASNQFLTPIKKTYGGSGDPIYDEYGNINANIRGISEKLHQGNSISLSPTRNNNKNIKGSRTTLGEGYFQEYKISNMKSQLKKQQQLQYAMEQEGQSIMDKMFDRQQERQMNRLQRHNEYMKDIERQMQHDMNIFNNPLTQQDRMMKMADDYHQNQHHIETKPQKSIFQEMTDENQKRKMRRDNQLEQYNNDLQEQIELKKQQKKMQNEIEKIKEKKEEDKLQKEREDLRKQMEQEAQKRKKILQDTDAENQKIIEQQKKLQKNQQKLQEKQNDLINEAKDLQNKLKVKTVTETRRMSQPTLDIPKSFNSDTQQQFNQGGLSPSYQQQQQLPSTQQNGGIYPINSTPFNQMKQKPSQYPPLATVNPVQKLYDNSSKLKDLQQNQSGEDIMNLRRELQNQTSKIQQDLLRIREDMQKQQKHAEDQQNNMLKSQENLIVNEISKIENQLKQQQLDIIEQQKQAISAQLTPPPQQKVEKEKKSRQSSRDFLKEAQDEMIRSLKEQQKQLVEEHKKKIQEEKQKRESEQKQHATDKMIQDFNVELQKKDMKEEMRFKILKNKIKDLDRAQNNALFLKTALATMQQTPRTQTEDYNHQKKHNLTYHEGDFDKNTPILQQHFHHTSAGEQNYYTHRSPSSPDSPTSLANIGYNTERKGRNNIITQHFHYDQLTTPRRPLSSQQGKKGHKQNPMISSAIQTNPINYQNSEFQVDSKMFVKELQPLPEPDCRKKRSCSRQKMAQSQLNYYNRQSPKVTLPIVKRRESLDLGQNQTPRQNKYPSNPQSYNQTFHNGFSSTVNYIDAWNNQQINKQSNLMDPINLQNNTMNDYLNNSLLTSPKEQLNKDQYNTKRYPHSLYQSAYQPNSKLRSSSLLTDRDQKQPENLPNTILDTSNLINKNLDILDAIVKASNHNRTKSSQKRSVNRYNTLKQKELQQEQDISQNLYSPYDNISPDTGAGLYTNASFSPNQPIYNNNNHNIHAFSRTTPWNPRQSRQSPQSMNFGSAERQQTSQTEQSVIQNQETCPLEKKQSEIFKNKNNNIKNFDIEQRQDYSKIPKKIIKEELIIVCLKKN